MCLILKHAILNYLVVLNSVVVAVKKKDDLSFLEIRLEINAVWLCYLTHQNCWGLTLNVLAPINSYDEHWKCSFKKGIKIGSCSLLQSEHSRSAETQTTEVSQEPSARLNSGRRGGTFRLKWLNWLQREWMETGRWLTSLKGPSRTVFEKAGLLWAPAYYLPADSGTCGLKASKTTADQPSPGQSHVGNAQSRGVRAPTSRAEACPRPRARLGWRQAVEHQVSRHLSECSDSPAQSPRYCLLSCSQHAYCHPHSWLKSNDRKAGLQGCPGRAE